MTDTKKMEKLGKLLAECQKGGIMLQAQVDHVLEALPNLPESKVDDLIELLQEGIVEGKELEEAGMRFENVDMPHRLETLEQRQEVLAKELADQTAKQWKAEIDTRMDEIAEEQKAA